MDAITGRLDELSSLMGQLLSQQTQLGKLLAELLKLAAGEGDDQLTRILARIEVSLESQTAMLAAALNGASSTSPAPKQRR